MYQVQLPYKYENLTNDELIKTIDRRKQDLREHLVILGHHYQRDEIIQFADFVGDSLELSHLATQKKNEYIIFCGVHFMAESADLLAGPDQKVLLPDMTAGCSMADMAAIDQVEDCWRNVTSRLKHPGNLLPLCYVNCSAAVKAFCGRNNGLSCTSSNCQKVLEWIWNKNPNAIVLFIPDEHLGRNTAHRMGVSPGAMPLWDPYKRDGGINSGQLAASRMILWKGFCSVHQEFTVEQITRARREHSDINIIVHPECPFEVAQSADWVGSTSFIVKTLRSAKPNSRWAVGTEINLVNRLTKDMAQQGIDVRSLNRYSVSSKPKCLCETMYRIDLKHLAWLLDTLQEHLSAPEQARLCNRVQVKDPIRKEARLALERMLAVTMMMKK